MNLVHAWLSRTNFSGYEQIGLGVAVTAVAGAGWWIIRRAYQISTRARDDARFEVEAVAIYQKNAAPDARLALYTYMLARVIIAIVSMCMIGLAIVLMPDGSWLRTALMPFLALFGALFGRSYDQIYRAYAAQVAGPAVAYARKLAEEKEKLGLIVEHSAGSEPKSDP